MEIKNLKIWPRKKSDRGGYACMPLKRNVPEGKKGWKLTTCPECGALCWKTPLLRTLCRQEPSRCVPCVRLRKDHGNESR